MKILIDFFKRIHTAILLFVVITISVSCSGKDEPPHPDGKPETLSYDKTVLVYMVADNNLNGYAHKDISEMKDGMSKLNVPEDCRWLVYYSGPDMMPRLIEIDRNGEEKVLAEYSTSNLSVSVARMQKVIADVKRLSPSESYGLVLWSHGTGWLSEEGAMGVGSGMQPAMSPLSFGYDGVEAYRMKITSLAKALEGTEFEFIYFDCCHMSTVEVAYEIRGATDVMVASAAELGVDGMPYNKNVAVLLKGDCKTAALNTYRFYAESSSYGCTISVLDLSAIENLASETKKVIAESAPLSDDYVPVKYFRPSVVPEGMYDMNHYINALCGADATDYASWKLKFDDVVSYHVTTSRVYGLNASNFSGLACNIVRSKADEALQTDKHGYRETAWWLDVLEPALK